LYLAPKHYPAVVRVQHRNQRNRLVAFAGLFGAVALTGCGNQYRPVVSAINPVGPAGQPTKFVVAVSNPSATPGSGTSGLLTVVDFSGDTVLATPQILTDPTYFALDTAGSNGYAINAESQLNVIPVGNPGSLLTSSVKQTTLQANSSPVSITTVTQSGAISTIYIPQRAQASIAALNSVTLALYDDISIGNNGSNPVYVVGASSTPRVYAISQNAPGSLGQIDALESTSTLQLADSATIPVGIKPVYGVMTNDVRRAFILNQGSGTVNVVNVPSNALDVTTPLITIPPIALAGGGTTAPNPVWADLAPVVTDLVVLNQGDGIHPGTLSIIQIPLCNAIAQPTNPNCNSANPIDAVGFGTIVATATVGVNPTMVSVLQDGTRAYVINSGNIANNIAGSVSVVNLASGVVTATLPGGADPSDTTTTPAGYVYGHPNSISATTGSPTGKVYVTSSDSRYLTVIYTDTDTVQQHISLQGYGLRVLVNQP
jgi:hypothetical protein